MPRAHHVAVGAVVLGVIVALAITLWPRRPPPEPGPILGAVPDFILTDQTGARFESAATLRGHPWVANFIFTRCTTVCPIFTAKMARLEQQTRGRRDGLRLVSFSVDPEYDTPERLAEFARANGADTTRWWFLTGPTQAITDTVVKAMKIGVERQPDKPVGESVQHGTHFVLVDAAMKIRGYYALSDADALERLERDLDRLQ